MDRTSKWKIGWTAVGLVALTALVIVLTVLAFKKVSAPVPEAGETPGYEPTISRQLQGAGTDGEDLPTADDARPDEQTR